MRQDTVHTPLYSTKRPDFFMQRQCITLELCNIPQLEFTFHFLEVCVCVCICKAGNPALQHSTSGGTISLHAECPNKMYRSILHVKSHTALKHTHTVWEQYSTNIYFWGGEKMSDSSLIKDSLFFKGDSALQLWRPGFKEEKNTNIQRLKWLPCQLLRSCWDTVTHTVGLLWGMSKSHPSFSNASPIPAPLPCRSFLCYSRKEGVKPAGNFIPPPAVASPWDSS